MHFPRVSFRISTFLRLTAFLGLITIFAVLLYGKFHPVSEVKAQTTAQTSWYMAGANPQRTSWVSEQVPATNNHQSGSLQLYPQWYKPIEPKIPNKVQIVAGNNTIFISTARGLYAFDATTGADKWVYATEIPLGHSPTYYETSFASHPKRLYVGGLDRKIHAIDAVTGVGIWTYEARLDGIGGGFETNPLVLNIGGTIYIYAGNRDGYMYVLKENADGSNTTLAWSYKTGGPILFSAAASKLNSSGQYDSNTKIYFASEDSYAYALNATTGTQVWKSAKLPGSGFSSYWPVVFTNKQNNQDYVVFSGSHNYRDNLGPSVAGTGGINMEHLDRELFNGADNYANTGAPCGTLIGQRQTDNWINTTIKDPRSAMSVSTYFQNKPWRRTVFTLDAATGVEITNYAPFLWLGSQSGNRFPTIGNPNDTQGVLYSTGGTYYRNYINTSSILGWRFGSSLVNTAATNQFIVDEPVYTAMGGNIVYWAQHQETAGGLLDTSVANTRFWDNAYDANCADPGWTRTPNIDTTREWVLWSYGDALGSPNAYLRLMFPNYDDAFSGGAFGGSTGSYGRNGDGNPPIPYNGRVYMLKGNSLLVMAPTPQNSTGTKLATAVTVNVTKSQTSPTKDQLIQKLSAEVLKMTTAGHIRPGIFSSGHVDMQASSDCGDYLVDYFHNTADTLWALSLAYPYLPTSPVNVAQQVKTYLQSEYTSYPPNQYTHNGFRDGVARDFFDLPPDLQTAVQSSAPRATGSGFPGWTSIPPYVLYAAYKYAGVMASGLPADQSKTVYANVFNAYKGVLQSPPTSTFATYPFAHNAYISGYYGYIQLEKAAGLITTESNSSKWGTYQSLITDRVNNFTTARGTYPVDVCNAFNTSRNFMFLMPEFLSEVTKLNLQNTLTTKVTNAVSEFNRITPYWLVTGYEDTWNEAIHQPMYDVTMFQAKAYVLGEKREELLKYLDAPFFKVGDLFYIQNLVAAIEAPSSGATPVPTATSGPIPTPTRTPTPNPACPSGSLGNLSCDSGGFINETDLSILLNKWTTTGPLPTPSANQYPANLSNDAEGKVDEMDLTILLRNWKT